MMHSSGDEVHHVAVLAVVLSLLAIALLGLLILGLFVLLVPNEGKILGLIVVALAALAQSLWVFPGLLISGAMLALLQARSRAF